MRTVLVIIVSVVLLAAAALSGMGPNLVLCVGADGHIELESGDIDGACHTEHDDHDADHASDGHHGVTFVEQNRCCLHCTDIPISTISLKISISSDKRSADSSAIAKDSSASHAQTAAEPDATASAMAQLGSEPPRLMHPILRI